MEGKGMEWTVQYTTLWQGIRRQGGEERKEDERIGKEKERRGMEGERRVAMTFNHCTIADNC
jgi:hypothetical protein